MIKSKKDLKEYIEADNGWMKTSGFKTKLIERLANYPTYELKKFTIYLRKQEYYINTANGSKIKGLLGLYYERKKNRLGMRLGIEIGPNCFGKGLTISHGGSIIVNSNVKAGDFCMLHGSNCLGNNGSTQDAPVLGNNVDIGVGAVIIGGVTVADNVKIGANTVVNRSITEEGSVYVGIPARKVEKSK